MRIQNQIYHLSFVHKMDCPPIATLTLLHKHKNWWCINQNFQSHYKQISTPSNQSTWEMHQCNGFVWIIGSIGSSVMITAVIFSLNLHQVWDEADYVVPPAENGAFFRHDQCCHYTKPNLGRVSWGGRYHHFSVRTYKLQKVQKYTNLNYNTKQSSKKK